MLEQRKQELLRNVADIVGRRELAARLRVTEALLDQWIDGQCAVPHRTLVALVDILDEVTAGK